MLWFYTLTLSISVLGLAFYFYWRNRHRNREMFQPGNVGAETADEIGIPPEALDPGKSFDQDRAAGVRRPTVAPPKRDPGAGRHLPGTRLRKDNLSKEVELDWEASEIIELQPGAWALPKDAAPDRREESAGERFRERYSLPAKYGANRLVLLARDPTWIYAYWDIAHDKYQEMYRRHLSQWGLSRPLLRLYDVTPETGSDKIDVYVDDTADNWYIPVAKPRHRFVAEYGRLFPEGFVPILRSNVVQLPPYGVSPITSEEWAPLDWETHYGRDGGLGGTSSPMNWGRQKH